MVNWSACIAAVLAVSGNGVLESGDEEPNVVSPGISVTVTADEEPLNKEDDASKAGDVATPPVDAAAPAKEQKRVEVRVQSRRESGDEGDSPKVVTQGRIVVIGPDGVRREYDLNDAEGRAVILKMDGGTDALAELENLSGQAMGAAEENAAEATEERMVIGVVCEEASALLRRHLKLANTGLVVVGVSDGRPAAEAGIEVDDVLVSINDQPLSTREELVNAVSASEGKELQLTLLRDGESRTVSVTPRKMAVPVAGAIMGSSMLVMPEEFRKMLGSGPLPNGQLIHPGVIVDREMPASPEALQKMLRELRSEAAATAPQKDGLAEQLEQLRAEVQKLREDVKRLQN